jgi:protein-S-isoprenylcysteine O-methyltransferase Ste14
MGLYPSPRGVPIRKSSKKPAKKKQMDRAEILVFPPLVPLTVLLAAVILGYMLPVWNQTPHYGSGAWLVFGWGVGLTGLVLMISSQAALRKFGTPIHPSKPTSQIVAAGPYRFSRNPMYLGINLLLLGISFLFYLPWVWAGFLIGLPIHHWGVVLQEEIYLERKFGKKYLDYKKRVRRWI